MNEPNELLMLAAIILFVAGFTTMMVGAKEMIGKVALSGILIMVLGVVIVLHPFWDVWYLFFKNAVLTIPTLAWIMTGITIYFTLNHIYVAWLFYAEQHPNGLTAKIIFPWPLSEIPHSNNPVDLYAYGSIIFVIWWLVAAISYTTWLIFGGGIAKLLHLLPREPSS